MLTVLALLDRSFSCKLVLHVPPKGTRSFEAPAAYPSKRSAKRAVSEVAIAHGIIEEARHSMTSMDRVGTALAPKFLRPALPKQNERYNEVAELNHAETLNMKSAETPVSALNLAVQKYCVELPTQAISYVYETIQSSTYLN